MATEREASAERILLYRLGSIGDFVISLPALHLVRRRFPQAEIRLLTNRPVDARAAPAMSLLGGSGLIDGSIAYAVATRDVGSLLEIRRAIRSFDPDLLVYLVPYRSFFALVRDWIFFRLCGVRRMVGLPFRRELRSVRPPASNGALWEREAHRLERTLVPLGSAGVDCLENYDLRLSDAELAEADRRLAEGGIGTAGARRMLGLSIGTKQPVKDWGDDNWRAVLEGLDLRDYGLVLIGSAEERERSQTLARNWPGTVLNLCGSVSPRVSAAIVRRVDLFLCHDSGPMHLAAAVGTRCVAVFSPKDPPGMWFPVGSHHRILYPPPGAVSIQAVRPRDVIEAVTRMLAKEVSREPSDAG